LQTRQTGLSWAICSLIDWHKPVSPELFPFWGCSGFDPWLECAVACRESKASRKITLEKTIGNYEEMPLAA